MARVTFSGMDDLMLSLKDIAEIPENVKADMLSAGADTGIKAMEQSLRNHNLVKTGTLLKSLKKRKKTDKNGELYYLVAPTGIHHVNKDGSKVRNAEVGFINEFGAPRKNIYPKNWMADANEAAADDVAEAEFEVYDEFLKSKNL